MTEGCTFIGNTNEDMVDFMRYVRDHGGECWCPDYEHKVIEVIRGFNHDKENVAAQLDRIDIDA